MNPCMLGNLRSVLVCLLVSVGYFSGWTQQIKVWQVYADNQHNAFTSLIRHGRHYYCAFRSGEHHVYGKDGVIKVLRSVDGRRWKEHTTLKMAGLDLRDPKLSVTPDGRIMALIGGSRYRDKELLGQKTHVSLSNKRGKKFSNPQPIQLPEDLASSFDWLWRVTWQQERGYGVLYQGGQAQTTLIVTSDGIRYEEITKLALDGRPNEATIRFDQDDRMFIMHRREEGDQLGYWGVSHQPFHKWDWKPMQYRLGGPDFCVIEGKFLAGTRMYQSSGQSVGLLVGDDEGEFEPLYEFPSEGDCSYPSFLVEEDRVLMTYYATKDGSTDIYIAVIPIDFIQNH